MSYPTSNELLARLIDAFGYPAATAEAAAQKLLELRSELRPAFESWWSTGELPDVEVGEYSVGRLMEELEMNPIAAFLALDWLVREPDEAKQTLARGYDRIARP